MTSIDVNREPTPSAGPKAVACAATAAARRAEEPHEDDSDLRHLLLRARSGDAQALGRVVDLYGNDLLRVVRRRLPRPVRRLYDSGDFLQAVWATFLANDVDPAAFDSSERLLAYLRQIAANKVSDQIRCRFARQKTCLDREVPIAAESASSVRSHHFETCSASRVSTRRTVPGFRPRVVAISEFSAPAIFSSMICW